MNHDKTNQSMSDEWIGKSARIKGESAYFLKKYGTSNPVIARLETDVDALGCSWMVAQGNPAALIYAIRTGTEGDIPMSGRVYYGKISGLGELVHESELEQIETTISHSTNMESVGVGEKVGA